MTTGKKKPKLILSSSEARSSRQFQNYWIEDYGMINKGEKAICALCSAHYMCRTSSVKRHYETIHKELLTKSKAEQKVHISQKIKERNKQSASLVKYISSESHLIIASFAVSNTIVKNGKPFSDGEYLKEAWLECAPYLFEDFGNKEKIIQIIKDLPLASNTVKDRILKMASNVREQQIIDLKSAGLFSLCLDERIV